LPDSTKSAVISWYKAAFNTTQISARYPITDETVGMGFNDGSFGMNTLDGVYNGGQEVGWYFWPKVVSAGQTDFWRTSAMGGETRPVRYQMQMIVSEWQISALLVPDNIHLYSVVPGTSRHYL